MRQGERATPERVRKEIKNMKKIFPAWYKGKEVITKAEVLLANYQHALMKCNDVFNDISPDSMNAIIWLYQFEFFEKEFFIDTYNVYYTRGYIDGSRHNSIVFSKILKSNYIEKYIDRDYVYFEEEDRGTHRVLHEKESKTVYRLSDRGLKSMQYFMTLLVKEKPKMYKTKNKILMFLSDTKSRLNNLNGGWDKILESI